MFFSLLTGDADGLVDCEDRDPAEETELLGETLLFSLLTGDTDGLVDCGDRNTVEKTPSHGEPSFFSRLTGETDCVGRFVDVIDPVDCFSF